MRWQRRAQARVRTHAEDEAVSYIYLFFISCFPHIYIYSLFHVFHVYIFILYFMFSFPTIYKKHENYCDLRVDYTHIRICANIYKYIRM